MTPGADNPTNSIETDEILSPMNSQVQEELPVSAMKHRLFSSWPMANQPTVELPNGFIWDKSLLPEWRYPFGVMAEATQAINDESLHFYITKDPYRLPEYGNHVVAILWQEERCKVPTYARHVRAVFRSLQLKPFLGFRPRLGLNKYEAVLTFQYARDWVQHLRSKRNMLQPHPEWPPAVHRNPRILTLPLGYHSQEELPQIPMEERQLDAFFAGEVHSTDPRNSYQYWTSTSKVEARKQLWNVLTELKQDPQWRIDLGNISGGDSQQRMPGYSDYSQKMMNSRICLAPRGTCAETFRGYEGWRAGCLVITNRLPPEPFLKGAPAIEIDNWKELPKLMKKYARNLDALEEYRHASLEFWKNRLSERAIGAEVAKFLKPGA
jgi:hypothetical protein